MKLFHISFVALYHRLHLSPKIALLALLMGIFSIASLGQTKPTATKPVKKATPATTVAKTNAAKSKSKKKKKKVAPAATETELDPTQVKVPLYENQ